MAGIILSGSRTIFVFFVVFLVVSVFIKQLRKISIIMCCSGLVLTLFAIIFLLFAGESEFFSRIMSISIFESTILGRFLYMIDAIIPIVTSPLGLGYQGYFYTQGGFQHGVYSVVYVHNDFMQMFLDGGFLAGISLIVLFVNSILSKTLSLASRLILIFVAAATMLDFHFQYLSILIIVLLCLEYYKLKTQKLKVVTNKIISIVFIVLNIYFTFVFLSEYFKLYDISLALYPNNTRLKMQRIEELNTMEEAIDFADSIYSYNDSIASVINIKALEAYSNGDIIEMIDKKLEEIELSRYNLNAYLEFIDQLSVAIELYYDANQTESANYCIDLLMQIPIMLEEVEQSTSPLGWMIEDKPNLELPKEYLEIIDSYR